MIMAIISLFAAALTEMRQGVME